MPGIALKIRWIVWKESCFNLEAWIQTLECKLMCRSSLALKCSEEGLIHLSCLPPLALYLHIHDSSVSLWTSHLIFWSINWDIDFFQIQPMDYKDCYVIKCLCIPGQTRTMHSLCFYQCNKCLAPQFTAGFPSMSKGVSQMLVVADVEAKQREFKRILTWKWCQHHVV